MSNHLDKDKLWLVGAGPMAVDYAKVLMAQNVPFEVIGRGSSSAAFFRDKTGISVQEGGLEAWLERANEIPLVAIVSVGVEELAGTTIMLLKRGLKRLLVEKPAGLNVDEIKSVAREAEKQSAKVFVAYNRRFYASTLKAQEIIKEDGGATSFSFEFTEWSHEIEKLDKPKQVKENWFLANSSHVVDLAFSLGGMPEKISSYTTGSLDWHPSAAVFAGAGLTKNGALFSYQANWVAPGRWGVEVLTCKHRLIFRPMEQLHIQEIGSIVIKRVELEDELDKRFKPGLYYQVERFLSNEDGTLLNINQHVEMLDFYDLMSGGRKVCNS